MPIVKFNAPEEFLAELTKDVALVDRQIVRATNLYRQSTYSPGVQHLSVVATARVGSDIVRLDLYCGDLWHIERQDTPVTAKAERMRRALAEGCARLGLEVRAGMLDEAE